jgi:hypothetical protein
LRRSNPLPPPSPFTSGKQKQKNKKQKKTQNRTGQAGSSMSDELARRCPIYVSTPFVLTPLSDLDPIFSFGCEAPSLTWRGRRAVPGSPGGNNSPPSSIFVSRLSCLALAHFFTFTTLSLPVQFPSFLSFPLSSSILVWVLGQAPQRLLYHPFYE